MALDLHAANNRRPRASIAAGYRLLFDRNPWPMWVYDSQTLGFLAVNEAAVAGYGYSEAEFLAMRLPDIRLEREQAALLDFLALPHLPRHPARHWRHRRSNGEVFDVEIISEAIKFDGHAARLVLAKDITQRLLAEAALRDSERRYRNIVETATEGIWTIDAAALTTFVNPKMAQMLGYAVHEMMGRALTDFMDERGVAITQRYLERRREGVAEQHEFKFQRKDGTELWTSMSSNPVFDDSGAYTGALAMVTDITERRQVEQQLKLLASSVARFNDIVIITEAEPFDESGQRILFVNDAFERRTGYSRAEALGRSPRFLQGPGTDQAELRRIGAALRRWQPVRSQLLNYTRQGEPFWIELDIVPIADDTGWFTHWVSVEHDITERKRIEARDASRDQVLTLIAAGAPLPDVLGAIVQGIEATHPGLLCSVLLLDASRLHLLRGATGSVPEFFNQAVQGLLIGPAVGTCGAAAYTGQRVICEDMQADVRWLPMHDLAARAGLASCWSEPILSHGGVVLGTFGVYQRVVARPTDEALAAVAEAARMAAIAIVRQRADEALRESQKMESLGTLAGGIAHDFNNILGAMLGNLALATQAGIAPDDAAARLTQVRQSALRARHLVQQILAFSRRQPHQAVHQPLAPLIVEAVALLRATLPASVQLQTRLAAEPVCAAVDAVQIHQVLVNLCTNAWHAMAGAAGQIELGLAHVAAAPGTASGPTGVPGVPGVLVGGQPGGWAHLWVQDNGQGMDDAVRARIFEPFFTTKPVGSGTGLGLSVVHGIVSEHQGRILVDSAPGQGATFHLYFPATEAGVPLRGTTRHAPDATATAPATPASPTDWPRQADGGNTGAAAPVRHILCVDDDAVILLTQEGLLTAGGYRVSTVASGREAVAAVRAAPDRFDLVVADFNMPELSGIDVARQIALIRPGLPVLICSGYIDAGLHAQADAAGVRALVHKESSAETLAATIRRVLGEPSA